MPPFFLSVCLRVLGKGSAPSFNVHYSTHASPFVLPLRLNSSRNHRRTHFLWYRKSPFYAEATVSPYEDLISLLLMFRPRKYYGIPSNIRDTLIVAAACWLQIVLFICYHVITYHHAMAS